ncbi:MAG TPA: glycosyltransferase [Candidatus Binataceae bacterium]|nr:glycosyltransferase [Candidatus Binataceae bacterium]
MRVLHSYSGNLYGGVETLLVTLARYRDRLPAMESEFALCFEGRLSKELLAVHARLHMIDEVRVRYPLSVRRARRRFRELLQHDRFDLVVCHSPWTQAIFGPAVRSADLPLAFWLHDPIDGRHWLERWARLTPPDAALCCSGFTASKLTNLYPGMSPTLIHHPVAFAKRSRAKLDRELLRAQLSTPLDATVIIQVGRMDPLKGHSRHLAALAKLRHLPRWILWQVGGPQRAHEVSYHHELQEQARQLGIVSRVRFLGERSDVPELLSAADIYCQPNARPEGFGITLIEALTAGLPVVATAFGGAQEIVDQSCGVLVPPDDIDALAESLRPLIEEPALRSILSAGGPARAQDLCDPDTQMMRLGEVLSGVCRQ